MLELTKLGPTPSKPFLPPKQISKMKKSALLLFVAMAMATSSLAQTKPPIQPNYYQLAEAEYAVYKTLRLVDSGNYRELWKRTTTKARGGLTESAWIETVASMRKVFGTYRDRKVERQGFSDKASDGDKGLFYLVVFQTEFSSLPAEEKMILVFEEGEWKLMGYFLKTRAAK